MTTSLPSRNRRSHQGFTLIEVLMVVSVIAVLVGLVFVAMRGTTQSAKLLQTRGALNNLNGLLAELEAANGLQRQPNVWLWTTQNGQAIQHVPPNPANTWTYSFWRGPYVPGAGGAPNTYPTGTSLASPGNVNDEPGFFHNQRNASIAIVNTALAMSMLAANPANRSRIQAMPQPQQFVPEWAPGINISMGPTDSTITLPGNDNFVGFNTDTKVDLEYAAGVHVRWVDNANGNKVEYFVAGAQFTGNMTPNPSGGGGAAAWNIETAAPYHVPLILDGWNNPIIFVPATGLRVRLLSGKKSLDQGDATQNFIVVSPEGATQQYSTTIPNSPFVTRPGRPFFASAGPDGDFTTGDDNVYSFEK